MATPKQITFTYKEIAELLARDARVQEGLWGLFVRFGLAAANIGASDDDMKPAAIVPIVEIGIQEFESANNLTIDAAGFRQRKSASKKPARK
jgi:hypothetical protein